MDVVCNVDANRWVDSHVDQDNGEGAWVARDGSPGNLIVLGKINRRALRRRGDLESGNGGHKGSEHGSLEKLHFERS